jgi:hypothetical protein
LQCAGNNVAEESVVLTISIADQSIRGKENLFVDSAENRCKSNVENLIQHNLVTIANEPTTSNLYGHALSVAASSPLISKEGLNSHNLVPIVEGTALDKVMTLVAISTDAEHIADIERNKDRPDSQRIDNNTAFENCSGVHLVSTCPAEKITLTMVPNSQPSSKDANRAITDAMQRVNILKTVWGDFIDEEPDMSDDEQEQNLEGEYHEGSIFTPFMSRRQKKYNQKKHANKLGDKGVQN